MLLFNSITGPMDYQKNLPILNEMANRYVNSSVVMYGLVANWIPMFKFYIDFKNAFGAKIVLNTGTHLYFSFVMLIFRST